MAAKSAVGPEQVDEEAAPVTGGEDFAFMMQAKPGAFVFLGKAPRRMAPSTHCIRPTMTSTTPPCRTASRTGSR
jgi:metal-dependent amidase/aminoacylase/carboxypeptidase family protein